MSCGTWSYPWYIWFGSMMHGITRVYCSCCRSSQSLLCMLISLYLLNIKSPLAYAIKLMQSRWVEEWMQWSNTHFHFSVRITWCPDNINISKYSECICLSVKICIIFSSSYDNVQFVIILCMLGCIFSALWEGLKSVQIIFTLLNTEDISLCTHTVYWKRFV